MAEQTMKQGLILIRCGMKGAPRILAGVKTDRRLEAMEAWNQISQRVVPGAALIAVEWLVILGIDFAA